jgi:hypothetical protein
VDSLAAVTRDPALGLAFGVAVRYRDWPHGRYLPRRIVPRLVPCRPLLLTGADDVIAEAEQVIADAKRNAEAEREPEAGATTS